MADEDEVIVSLPGDTSTVVVKSAKADDDDPVVDLKGQFAAMQQRATQAETEAAAARQQLQETSQRLHATQGEVVTSQLDTVTSGIAAAETEAAAAEQAYVAAHEAGDGLAMARAQRAIAAAEARKVRLEEAKDELEDQVKRRPARPDPTHQQQPQRRVDPVEAFTSGMSARSAAWVRAHPECVTDPKMNARMLAAHNLALADDIKVDTDEYFERIEAGIKPAGAKRSDAGAVRGDGDGRRPSSAAAPSNGGGGGSVSVSLTKREAESATDGTLVWNYDDPTGQKRWAKGDPIGLAEMARRKHEGKKQGLYDRMQYEA